MSWLRALELRLFMLNWNDIRAGLFVAAFYAMLAWCFACPSKSEAAPAWDRPPGYRYLGALGGDDWPAFLYAFEPTPDRHCFALVKNYGREDMGAASIWCSP